MGVEITEKHGYLNCTAPKGLHGARIILSIPSVGATENIMLAAVTAKGTTEIHNCAREPEIKDLASFLRKCGAKIKGAGTGLIVIEGVPKLGGAEHKVISDRIVAATYLCCAAITRGELVLKKANHADLQSVIPVFEQMGCTIYTYKEDNIYINARKPLKAPRTVRTSVHPGFPTDSQPMVMALAATLKGTTMFVETIFENRFRHANELRRLGADIRTEGRVAIVEGVEKFSAADLEATDLRGGAALVTAALFAEGTSTISEIHYIERGYDNLDANLRKMGLLVKKQ
jgi:UDP-N-acetylglucosamine 1-carboxyvinyltransferase